MPPDCPVHQRSNGYQHNGRLQRTPANATMRAEVREAARGTPDSGQYLSGATRRQSSNGRLRPNSNGWVTWLAHRNVRCAHRQQPSPTAVLVVVAINTPNHHHSRHPSILYSSFNTRAIHNTPRHKSKPSIKSKSTIQL